MVGRGYFYVAVAKDSELHVVGEAEALHVHKDDLFGPYRSYQEAADAAISAEMYLFYLLAPHVL